MDPVDIDASIEEAITFKHRFQGTVCRQDVVGKVSLCTL